jgi:phosphomethylpyrimidine synthase
VREYAETHGLSENEAIEKGLEEKSVEFEKTGGEMYV